MVRDMKRAARSISLLLLAAASLTTACATGAKPGGMSPGGPLELRELEAAEAAELPTLTLQTTGGRATKPLHISQISNGAFTEALAMEILRRGAFRPVYDRVAD
jgi:hypothetical protein